LLLRSSQQGLRLINQDPAGSDEPRERLPGITIERHFAQNLLATFEALDECVLDELCAGLEMPEQRHPADAGLAGDVAHDTGGMIADRGNCSRQDLGPVALRVGPLIDRTATRRRSASATACRRGLLRRHAPPHNSYWNV